LKAVYGILFETLVDLCDDDFGIVDVASDGPRRRFDGFHQPYRLAPVIQSGGPTGYRIDDHDLDSYLIPKKPQPVTPSSASISSVEASATPNPPFAYLFQRIS
jgi:hypothetical protein